MITLDLNSEAFRPGEQLTGNVSWALEKEPKKMEIRLFWYTQGKGTEDAMIVDVRKIDSAPMQGMQEFNFVLPRSPYSFSGKLISLIWAIEFVVKPSEDNARKDFILAPEAVEINL